MLLCFLRLRCRLIGEFMSVLHFVRDLPPATQKKLGQVGPCHSVLPVCTIKCSICAVCCVMCACAASQAVKYTVVDKDHMICEQGAEATEFYIVMSGSMSIKVLVQGGTDTRVTIATLEAGSAFGEIGLLRGGVRQVSVISREPAELLWINDAEFYVRDVTQSALVLVGLCECGCEDGCWLVSQELGLAEYFSKQLDSKRLMLERVGIFGSLTPAEMDYIASVAQPLHVDRGTVLQQQGSVPDALYILTRGICKVMKAPNDEASLEARLKEVRLEISHLVASDVYHHSMRPSLRCDPRALWVFLWGWALHAFTGLASVCALLSQAQA